MKFIAVFSLAIMPAWSVYDSIVLGKDMHLPIWETYGAAILGGMLPVPFLLMALNALVRRYDKLRGINEKFSLKFEIILLIISAIPFVPASLWIGSLVAALSGVPVKKALLIICLGCMISGVIVLAVLSSHDLA